jgi:hypothetical protein
VPSFASFADLSGKRWGWGPVNAWREIDPVALASACVRYGCRILHIEYITWTARGLPDAAATARAYERLLAECRRRKVTLFVSAFNDNAHLSKHGHVGVETPRDYLRDVAVVLRRCGSEGVIVQPTAETQTDTGRWFEGHCQAVLAGFPRVYNGGSRPTSVPAGYRWAAYHPRAASDSVPGGLVAVTDTGTILHELGLYTGGGDPAKCAAWVRRMLGRGNPAILYQFRGAAISDAMLAAVSSAAG